MVEIELHLAMYLDRMAKNLHPPTLREVEEALEKGSTTHPKGAVLPHVCASDSKTDQEDVDGKT